jgi:hypothetical protein
MWALTVAVIYFGTFLVIGWAARRVLDEVHRQAGPRGERTVFLLGSWRRESDS